MFFKALLASLFVSAAVAAPAPAAAPPIIKLESNVSCTNVVASSATSSPSPRIILLNSPSASPSASSGYYGNYAAPAVQPSVKPHIIQLNASASSPPVLKLNRRQFFSTSSASTFPSSGTVPPSTPASTPPSFSTPTTTTTTSPSPAPTSPPTANPAVQGGASIFTATGTDGVQTVFILSTATVTASCSNPPAVPSSGIPPSSPPAQFPAPPTSVIPSIVSPSSSPAVSPPFPALVGNNAQNPAPVASSSVPTSTPSPSPIILN